MVHRDRNRALCKLLGHARILAGERIVGILQRQFFECSCRFREHQMSQRVVRQVRQLQRDRCSTQAAHGVQHGEVGFVSEIAWRRCSTRLRHSPLAVRSSQHWQSQIDGQACREPAQHLRDALVWREHRQKIHRAYVFVVLRIVGL